MNNKKKNEGQTDFSYYGLYLLDYLRTNRFEQTSDEAFIRERADRAAGTYERARLNTSDESISYSSQCPIAHAIYAHPFYLSR